MEKVKYVRCYGNTKFNKILPDNKFIHIGKFKWENFTGLYI